MKAFLGIRTEASWPNCQKDEVFAVEDFLARLTDNFSVIALKRIAGDLKDVWISDNPAEDFLRNKQYDEINESIEFRLWNGTTALV